MDFFYEKLNDIRLAKGQMLFLTGESGIGKTRLAKELLKYAKSRNTVSFKVSCDRYNIKPYYIFTEFIKNSLNTYIPTIDLNIDEKKLIANLNDELSLLSMDLKDKAPNNKQSNKQKQLFLYILKYLKILSSKNPVILFIDDLENINEDNLELLEYLLENISFLRILICGAVRDEELETENPILHNAISRFDYEDIFSIIKIPQLENEAVKELINQILGHTEHLQDDIYDKIFNENKWKSIIYRKLHTRIN